MSAGVLVWIGSSIGPQREGTPAEFLARSVYFFGGSLK
jgi:hypothetical protein